MKSAMSADNALSVILSDASKHPLATHKEMPQGSGEMAEHSVSSHTLLMGGGIFLLLILAFLGGMFFRRPFPLQPSKPSTSGKRIPGKAVLGAGVFVILTGGILAVTSYFQSAGMADMDGMEMSHDGMSHDDMMQVDGAFNPTPVRIETVQPAPLEVSVQYTGSIYPYEEVTLYPRVAGQLTHYSVYPGDAVEAGQLLAQLSADERLTEVSEAKAEHAVMQAELQTTQAEIDEQQQEIERLTVEVAYLETKRDRFATLAEGGVISQDEYDIVATEAKAQQEALEGAKVRVSRLTAQADRDRAKINQAQAKIETASVMEAYTQLRSPITGMVRERMVDPGVVVQPGMGVLKIGDYQQLRLRANVAQQDAAYIRPGTPVVAKIPGAETTEIKGRITSIFPQTDMSTRTVTVEAVVDNPEEHLLAGQFLEMQIITSQKSDALSVPQTAVTEFNDEPAVWVVAGDVSRRRRVVTGLISRDRIEITSGLQPGDQVITSGHSRLMENSRVAIVDAAGNLIPSLGVTSQGNVEVQLISPEPEQSMGVGKAELILAVQDPKTSEPLAVDALAVNISMPMKNMAPMTAKVEIEPAEAPGRFKVETYFGMKGEWIIEASVKEADYQGQTRFMLQVE